MSTQHHVQVPHSYFKKAKSEYREWRWAVVREFIQNSYDAQSTHIDFNLSLDQDKNVVLTVTDNGCGMSEDTLVNVLLCMGGSQKLEGAIGGFGYAKAILFFAHKRYVIASGQTEVSGTGGSYDLTHTSAVVNGTAITVTLEDDTGDDRQRCWKHEITRYVAQCWMEAATGRGVVIALNGNVLEQQNDREYDVQLTTELGEVWYDEKRESSHSEFMVSIGGLPMFREHVYSDASPLALHGGLELAAGSSALTANRDGFNTDMRDKFSKLSGYLVQNQTATRYGKALDLSINFDANASEPTGSFQSFSESSVTVEAASKLQIFHSKEDTSADVDGYRAVVAKICRDNYPRNFHVKVDAMTTRRAKATEAYITSGSLVSQLNLHRNAKLARSWRTAISTILNCDWALENGVAFYDGLGTKITDWDSFDGDAADLAVFFNGRRVDVGFCFTRGVEGLCTKSDSARPHSIYLNPLTATSDPAYRFHDMLDVAFHECAHLWAMHHGEEFCGVEGKLRNSMRRWMSDRDTVSMVAASGKAFGLAAG